MPVAHTGANAPMCARTRLDHRLARAGRSSSLQRRRTSPEQGARAPARSARGEPLRLPGPGSQRLDQSFSPIGQKLVSSKRGVKETTASARGLVSVPPLLELIQLIGQSVQNVLEDRRWGAGADSRRLLLGPFGPARGLLEGLQRPMAARRCRGRQASHPPSTNTHTC